MKKILKFVLLLIMAFIPVFSYAAGPITPNSFHFQAVPNGSVTCSATTGGATASFGSDTGAPSLAPDVIVRNIGTVPIYFEIGVSGATAAVATSQVINPGEADLLSKYQSDLVSCITSSGSASLIATPGTGN